MKTILVVYTNVKLTNKEIADNKLTKYAFRTSEDVEVGDLIESKDYNKSMQVIAGAVGYILQKRGRKVTIVISRKSENTHGGSMAGYHRILNGVVPVVIDDFVSSGNTINEILIDLDKCVNKKTYPFLCIANFWSMNKLEANRKKPDNISYDVANRFETIICNNPEV